MAGANSLPIGVMTRMAWRNLWRNHRRTLIMLLAIAVGVWAMIFMTALMRGMVDQMIEDGIDSLPGFVQIHHPAYRDDPSVENSLAQPGPALLEALQSSEVTGWTTRVRVPAMIASERDSRGVTLLGVDPKGEIALGFDPESIVAGRFLQSPDDTGLVIGRKLLERLETDLGKRVVVMSQDPENNIADRGFRIVGVYKAKLAAMEELVKNAADKDAQVQSWTELDTYLGLMLGVMDGFVLVWIIVIFLALSFGLVNTLMMAVFERVREFGLMQALGMKPSAIRLQVLLESVMLLVLGLLAGNLLAIASILPIQDGIDLSAVAEGMEMMGVSSILYPALTLKDIVMANTVVIVLGILTSLLPAWRASQYSPVEAIAKT